MSDKEMADFLQELRNRNEMPIDGDEYYLIGEITERLKEQEAEPICKIIFDVPYYFCGDCKAMLNMYATKAEYCSACGKRVAWKGNRKEKA